MQMALCSTKIKQITYSRTQPGAGTHTDARGEFEEYHGMSDIESAVVIILNKIQVIFARISRTWYHTESKYAAYSPPFVVP